ncbi:unnamed protein product [Sphagnum jensenii]|jgi:hypothetical protein
MFGRRKARAAANQQEYAATTGGAPGVDGSGYDAAAGVPAGGGADYVQQPQYVDQNGGPLGNNNNNAGIQKPGGYGGGNGYDNNQGYVAGPDGGDNYDPQRKKKNSAANKCAACFVACWAVTWPCHGPCCCGL